ncbi:hypothetical protein CHE29_06420 [Salmonella enterica]|nr:hypothetical protein CHE29_06420 [Salmonella enterica]
MKYEQYFGDDVALFGTDHLQTNPNAITVGLSYTPIPLVTFAADYKREVIHWTIRQYQCPSTMHLVFPSHK